MTFKTKSAKVLTRMIDRLFAAINEEDRLYNFETIELCVGADFISSDICTAKKRLVKDLLAYQKEVYWHEQIKVDINLFSGTKVVLVTAF